MPPLLNFVLCDKSHQVVTAALHEKDEDHREEDAFVICTDKMSKEFGEKEEIVK